jgi:hypothetical protein
LAVAPMHVSEQSSVFHPRSYRHASGRADRRITEADCGPLDRMSF